MHNVLNKVPPDAILRGDFFLKILLSLMLFLLLWYIIT